MAPFLTPGWPTPPPGSLVGGSRKFHCDGHLKMTVTVTDHVHRGLLVRLDQSEEGLEQAMSPPRLSHPGLGGMGSAIAWQSAAVVAAVASTGGPST
jgi:hypothetical protein